MLGILLATALAVELPLIGAPLGPGVANSLEELPGVAGLELADGALTIEVAPGASLSFTDIVETLRDHTVATELDADRIGLGPNVIFQLDAGQCFHCTEQPLKARLSRKDWVKRWAVVGYAPFGRMHVRIEPKGEAELGQLGALPYEDILFTRRYDGIDEVFHDWPTGGVEWRATEEEARAEAARSKKPLFFFPSAGT